jgi:hypothetical protein
MVIGPSIPKLESLLVVAGLKSTPIVPLVAFLSAPPARRSAAIGSAFKFLPWHRPELMRGDWRLRQEMVRCRLRAIGVKQSADNRFSADTTHYVRCGLPNLANDAAVE